MTALRNFKIAQVRTGRMSRRAAPPGQRERLFRALPGRPGESPVRASWARAVARAVARLAGIGAEVLFGLWGLAVLGLFMCVAIALVR